MLLSHLRSLTSLIAGGALIAGAALGTTSGGQLGSSPGGEPVNEAAPRLAHHFAPTCIGYCQHPTNAAKVFRWGLEAWEEEAEGAVLDQPWRSNHPGLVTSRVGMLTIEAKPNTPVVRVRPTTMKAAYGRWEARVRAVELETSNETFEFTWELVPARKGEYHCGGRSIVMASYRPGTDNIARGAVRGLDGTEFAFSRGVDLRSRAWHTYAVEVTKDHISWFVDTKVVHTERRAAALTGVTFKPRFRIQGDPDATMNHSRMQMDWVRYYDLHRPNAESIDAPAMEQRTYAEAC
jgi:hypothetical protein